MSKRENKVNEFLEDMLTGLMNIGLFIAFSVILYQVVMWMKDGVWIPVTFGWGIEYLGINLSVIYEMEWMGIRKIATWILELPLSLMSFALCFFLYLMLSILIDYLKSFFTQTEGDEHSLNK